MTKRNANKPPNKAKTVPSASSVVQDVTIGAPPPAAEVAALLAQLEELVGELVELLADVPDIAIAAMKPSNQHFLLAMRAALKTYSELHDQETKAEPPAP